MRYEPAVTSRVRVLQPEQLLIEPASKEDVGIVGCECTGTAECEHSRPVYRPSHHDSPFVLFG